jgi:micrococcal nuclease
MYSVIARIINSLLDLAFRCTSSGNRSADVKSYGVDRYGRVLGEVFVDGNNVNLEMVKAGLAEVYRGNPAQGQDVGPYWKAEETAKKAGPGMWVLGIKYVSPRDWRKTHQN